MVKSSWFENKQKEHLIDSALRAPQCRGTGSTPHAEVERLACAVNGEWLPAARGRRHRARAGVAGMLPEERVRPVLGDRVISELQRQAQGLLFYCSVPIAT